MEKKVLDKLITTIIKSNDKNVIYRVRQFLVLIPVYLLLF